MYGREVDGEVLSFGHAGILYENSFVMYDRKTESLWVHVTGRAESGPMKGKRLRFFPSSVTTWQQWKQAHPETVVLAGRRRGGFMGTYDPVGRARELGLAVVVAFKGKLYPYQALAGVPVVNDRFNGVPVVVVYSRDDGTAVAWQRTANGRELTFDDGGMKGAAANRFLRDRETGTLWTAVRGEAVEGRLAGARLESISHNPILVDRFRAFYPEGPVWTAGAEAGGRRPAATGAR